MESQSVELAKVKIDDLSGLCVGCGKTKRILHAPGVCFDCECRRLAKER